LAPPGFQQSRSGTWLLSGRSISVVIVNRLCGSARGGRER